jgi:hypothetical protein
MTYPRVNEDKVKKYSKIQALINGRLAPKCDPIKESFPWSEGPKGRKIWNKKLIGEASCWSFYGHPSLFKPSLGEIINSTPDHLLEKARYVEIVGNTSLHDGVHLFRVKIYKRFFP